MYETLCACMRMHARTHTHTQYNTDILNRYGGWIIENGPKRSSYENNQQDATI